MVTRISDIKPISDEKKILGQKTSPAKKTKPTEKIVPGTRFLVTNLNTQTKTVFEWASLRHMFDAKIEKMIYDAYPAICHVPGFEIEPMKG